MQQVKLPLITTSDNRQAYAEEHTGGYASSYRGPKLTNAQVVKSDSGEMTIMPRFGIDNRGQNTNSTTMEGFGVATAGNYYNNSRMFAVVGDTLYSQTTGALNASWTYWSTIGSVGGPTNYGLYTIVSTSESDIWVSASGAAYTYDGTTLSQVTDPDYPTRTIPGAVWMDGYVFVADMDGKIYNSDVGDPTSWVSTNFLTAERKHDRAVWIGKHHNHIVLFKESSIEFFYNAGNPSGSPLARRNDAGSTSIGMLKGELVSALDCYYFYKPFAEMDDVIYFIGSAEGGTLGLYALENFQIRKLSGRNLDKQIDYIFSSANSGTTGTNPILGACNVGGKKFVTLSAPASTNAFYILFDLETGVYSHFTSNDPAFDEDDMYLAAIAWAYRDTTYDSTTSVYPHGGATHGFSHRAYLMLLMPDVAKDIDASSNDLDIDLEIITPLFDGDTPNRKFIHSLEIDGDYADGETVEISWTDDDYQTFSTGRSVDISNRTKLTRLGQSVRRAFKFAYSSQVFARFRSLYLNYTTGSN